MSDAPSARGTALLAFALLLLLAGALFREALLGGEVLSQADALLTHPPWSATAPPGLLPGNPSLSDQATQFQPWALLILRQLAAGEAPLWNPHAACGQPLLANLQSAALSPFSVWLHLLPFGAALLAIALSKLLLAGLGTAFLARRLGCSAPAAAFAGLAFAFGGFELLWLGHPHSGAAALLPLLLLLVERWLAEGGRGWLPALWALAVAALLLAGHPETALHAGLAAALWAVLRSAGRPGRARLLLLARLLLWSVVGAAIAGVQLLPFAEYLRLSEAYAQRSGWQDLWHEVPWRVLPLVLLAALLLAVAVRLGRAAALDLERGLHARALALAAGLAAAGAGMLALLDAAGLSPLWRLLWWPDAFGHPVPARELPFAAPRAYVNINGGYAGLVTLPLALVGALCAARRPALPSLRWLWLAAAVLGFELPLVSHLLNRLPLLDLALNYRLTFVAGLAAALLAGFGLDALAAPGTRRRPLVVALLVGGALALAAWAAPRVPLPRELLPERPRVHSFPADGEPAVPARVEPRWPVLGAAAALLLVLAAGRRPTALSPLVPPLGLLLLGADLYLFGRGFNPSAPPEQIFPGTPVTDHLAEVQRASPEDDGRLWAIGDGLLPPETAGAYALRDVRGYDALGIERMALFRALLAPRGRTAAPGEDLDLTHPLFGLLDVGFVLAPPDWVPPEGADLVRERADACCALWRRTGWRARAFVVGEALDMRPFLAGAPTPADLPAAAAARLHALNVGGALADEFRGASDPARVIAVEGDVPRAPAAGFAGSARLLERTTLRQEYEVTASAPGWLCVTDAFFPGWRAEVDGAPAEIVPAFFAFRAVAVPQGTSRVVMRYEPASLRWGAALTAAGLLALAAGASRGRRRT